MFRIEDRDYEEWVGADAGPNSNGNPQYEKVTPLADS